MFWKAIRRNYEHLSGSFFFRSVSDHFDHLENRFDRGPRAVALLLLFKFCLIFHLHNALHNDRIEFVWSS